MVLEFNKCCFYIKLRTGCLIISYLNLIVALIMILLLSVAIAKVENAVELLGGAFSDSLSFAVIPIMLAFLILFVAFTIALLVGVHLHKHVYVKAYLIYALFFIVMYIIMFLASFAGSRYDYCSIFKDIHSLSWNTYFFLVVRSYYLKMTPTIQPNKPI